ncbi:MAG: hypothetical protein Q8R55_03195 [Candidatus Taylorbacteria bacterium]|nr:hypothetical protein [Candidatus Taylorbacteria bacterium]
MRTSVQEVQARVSEVRANTATIRATTDLLCVVSELVATVVMFGGAWMGSGMTVAACGFLLLSATLTRIQIAVANVDDTIYQGIREMKD